jgi:erythromycin esterase
MCACLLVGCAKPRPPQAVAPVGGALQGRVVDAAQVPVAGAQITIARDGGDIGFEIVSHVTTDADGVFRAGGLGAGVVHISAASAAHLPWSRCDVAVSVGSPLTLPDVVLEAGGASVSGEIVSADGAPVDQGRLVITPFTPQNGPAACGAISLLANADSGYAARISPGLHAFFGRASGHVDAIAVEMVAESRAHDYRLDPAAEPVPAPDEVIDWVRQALIPLDHVAPGAGFDDLQAFGEVVGDARVIALGESTHGTREFFQLKHRVFEYLVAEKGVTALALEAAMPEAFDLNRYVLTGEGDPRQALAALYFWTWDTEEVLALVEWMRAWNEVNETSVRFYGVDVQHGGRAFERVSAYLTAHGVMPDLPALQPLARARTARTLQPSAVPAAQDLIAAFDTHRDALVAASSEAEFDEARQCAVVLHQHAAFVARQRPRDLSMADNVQWVLEREEKVVVWGHNAHVSVEPGSGAMGAVLREALGADLLSVGLEFGSGRFRAIPFPFWQRLGVQDLSVPALEDESLPAMLSRVGVEQLALDLRTVPDDGVVREWFSAMRPAHAIGAGFPPGSPGYGPTSQLASRQFDALLFVQASTPTRPNPTGVSPARHVHPGGDETFETAPLGAPPAGWTWRPQHEGLGYRADVVDCGASRCAELRKGAGPSYGQGVAHLTRRVALDPAQTGVTLRVSARVHSSGEGSLEVRLEGGEAQRFGVLGREETGLLTDDAWQDIALDIAVPEGARFVVLQLALEGAGAVRLNSIEVTPLAPD